MYDGTWNQNFKWPSWYTSAFTCMFEEGIG